MGNGRSRSVRTTTPDATVVGPGRHRVVVIGSGFGGYFAARHLRRRLRSADVTVTMLSSSDGLVYSPLLPDVAAGSLEPRSIVVPTAERTAEFAVVRGHASAVDLDAKTVSYAALDGSTQQLGYDRLLLCPGSVTRLLDIPGLAERAIGLKTVAEAMYVRDHVLGRLESANSMTDPHERRAALTFLVVGAGYAGTELAAQMARLTAELLPRYPNLHRDEVHWLLVDVASAVMPELGSALGEAALALLRRRDVDVRLGVSVKAIEKHRVELTDGTTLDCATVVWCAGVTASPLIGDLGLPTERGRLRVDEYLRVPGHPSVYALGDAAAVPDLTKPMGDDGTRPICPPTAQHAMRQATAAARNIAADLGCGSQRPYRHRDLGLVVDLGGPDAAATPVGLRLKGRPAKLVARGYHLFALPTLNRRLRVAIDWAFAAAGPADDVALGLLSLEDALAADAEHGIRSTRSS